MTEMKTLNIGSTKIKCPVCGSNVYPKDGIWSCNWCLAKSTDEQDGNKNN